MILHQVILSDLKYKLSADNFSYYYILFKLCLNQKFKNF